MSTPETDPTGTGEAATAERCERCGVPVEATQRYCVNCGHHRAGVPDPAAAYLARAAAPAAVAAAAPTPVPVSLAARWWSDSGLVAALACALVPVAAVVGVAVGRSSNAHDGQLIRALERSRAAQTTTVVAAAVPSGVVTAAAGPATVPARPARRSRHTAGHRARVRTTATPAAKHAATRIAGAKVSSTAQRTGSAEAAKVQRSTGQNYVNNENSLPSSVAVGP